MAAFAAERLHDLLIVGAGPAGLECAAAAVERGLDCVVLERGRVGEHVRRWGFVRMFTPWAWNVSERGARLAALDADPEELPTGEDFVRRYLIPLAESSALAGRVRESTRVLQISRLGLRKEQRIGDVRRGEPPFVALVEDGAGNEQRIRARAVVDASGSFATARWLGDGGIPALGERGSGERIAYRVEELPPSLRGRYAVIGAGYSAATMLDQLRRRDVDVDWIVRDRPLSAQTGDPLMARRELGELCERIAHGEIDRIRLHAGVAIARCANGREGLRLQSTDATDFGPYERVYAMVGYRPDLSILQELQFHACYATEGPMKLAAALLAQSGAADCLEIGDVGADSLRSPEPGLFVLGAKSYGRNAEFLLQRLGAQIEAAMDAIQPAPASPQ